MDGVVLRNEYNEYPDIITFEDKNPTLRSQQAITDLPFYQTRETLKDVDTFRNFIRNAETRFRASKEYKAYKSYLIESLGINRCQIFGNITVDDADIELHHNIIGLFQICILITLHIVNTVGMISTFDLIQLLIQEHWANRVGITFLCKTSHQVYTNDPEGYIPPEMTFGAWWELLNNYKYGITYDIANRIINYLKKYQSNLPVSVNIPIQDEILSYAYYNEYGTAKEDCGYLPYNDSNNAYSEFGF